MSFLRGKTAKGMLRTPGSSDSMYQKTVIDNVLLKPYTTLEVAHLRAGRHWTHPAEPRIARVSHLVSLP